MIECLLGTRIWIALRNYALDLPVYDIDIDFAVTAKPVLRINQFLNEITIRCSRIVIAESRPIL